MTSESPAQAFAAALQQSESEQDSGPVAERFSDEAELLRPESQKSGSSTGDAKAFWDAYLAQFDEIRTEFTSVQETDTFAALEWTSTGRLATGRDISYRGVSVLTMTDGQVTRFATYYDTAAFLEPTS
jgi:ketosteroid isomerase-like protein